MNNSNPCVIQTTGLAKTYKGVQALQPLNLEVREHSICGFLGPNGAGKTTTIKLLLGLARPTGGSGRVFGLDIEKHNDEIRRRGGYLAQDPRFYEYMTARQTLCFTARFFYEGPRAEIERRIAETLELVGLDDKADRPIKGFSGGERQRLGIAQAQVNYPDLLILDEPAASLDPIGRKDVLEVMERLRKHTTIFYSTHILDDVQRVSDTVIILNKGALVAQGPDRGAAVTGSDHPVHPDCQGRQCGGGNPPAPPALGDRHRDALEERQGQLADPGQRPGGGGRRAGAPGAGRRWRHSLRVWAQGTKPGGRFYEHCKGE